VTRKTLASAFRLFEEGEGKAIISKPQCIYWEFTVLLLKQDTDMPERLGGKMQMPSIDR
jgi:hypothetical protein